MAQAIASGSGLGCIRTATSSRLASARLSLAPIGRRIQRTTSHSDATNAIAPSAAAPASSGELRPYVSAARTTSRTRSSGTTGSCMPRTDNPDEQEIFPRYRNLRGLRRLVSICVDFGPIPLPIGRIAELVAEVPQRRVVTAFAGHNSALDALGEVAVGQSLVGGLLGRVRFATLVGEPVRERPLRDGFVVNDQHDFAAREVLVQQEPDRARGVVSVNHVQVP